MGGTVRRVDGAELGGKSKMFWVESRACVKVLGWVLSGFEEQKAGEREVSEWRGWEMRGGGWTMGLRRTLLFICG